MGAGHRADAGLARCSLRRGRSLLANPPDPRRPVVTFRQRREKFRVACNLFTDHLERQREIEDFWLDVVGVPRTCLTKTMVNHYSKYSQKKRRNKLPYGTCTVTVHSTQIAQHLYGAIQEYGGFERPEWLD